MSAVFRKLSNTCVFGGAASPCSMPSRHVHRTRGSRLAMYRWFTCRGCVLEPVPGVQTRRTHACEHVPREGVVRHASSGRRESSPFSVEAVAAWLFYAGALSPLRMEENGKVINPCNKIHVFYTNSGLYNRSRAHLSQPPPTSWPHSGYF